MPRRKSLAFRDRYDWYLEGFTDEDTPLRRLQVRPLPFRIGRDPTMHLPLSHASISKMHAEICRDGEKLVICDLGSTNGTYVNNRSAKKSIELHPGDIITVAHIEFRVVCELAHATLELGETKACDRKHVAGMISKILALQEMMKARRVSCVYQPLVRLRDRETIGFELLGRGMQKGLIHFPLDLFETASGLGSEAELSRLFRIEGMRGVQQLPSDCRLFLNIHPRELHQMDALLSSLAEARAACPHHPMAVELHEGAVTDIRQIRSLYAALREMDILFAYDDFGAGQARLLELVEVPPDFLKFDMKLIQGIHKGSARRLKMVRALVAYARDEGVFTIAEGVECREDADACIDLAFEGAQGFFFGKPLSLGESKTIAHGCSGNSGGNVSSEKEKY